MTRGPMPPRTSKTSRRMVDPELHHPRPVNVSRPIPGLPPTPSPVEGYLLSSPNTDVKCVEVDMAQLNPESEQPPSRDNDELAAPPGAPAQPLPTRPHLQTQLSAPTYYPIPPLQFYSPGLTPNMSQLASPWATTPQTISPQHFSPGVDPATYPAPDGYFVHTPVHSSYMKSESLSGAESEVGPQYASTTPSSPVKRPNYIPQPPRPPNAWILYRSDMLKAIAAGRPPPGLDELMQEGGTSSSSPARDEASNTGTTSTARGKKKKVSRPKKGSKEPSEAFVSTLGKGKLGRGIPQADISKMISRLWRRETPAIKGKYESMSKQRKAEHDRMYPDYKFQPMRKADKIKLREEKEREREELKRQKELERSGGRVRRRARARDSLSSPYTPGGGSSGPRIAGRALSFNSPDSSGEEQKFSSYPFPIPINNLPSMKSEEHAHAPYGTPVPISSATAPPMRTPGVSQASPHSPSSARRDRSPQKPRVPHRLAAGFTASEGDSEPPLPGSRTPALAPTIIRHVSNLGHPEATQDEDAAESPGLVEHPHDGSAGQPHVQAALHEVQPGIFVPLQPGWVNVPHLGPAYAFPATFHPMPLPADLDPDYMGEAGSMEDISDEQALRVLAAQPAIPGLEDALWVEMYPGRPTTSDSGTTDASIPMRHTLSANGSISGESSSSYGFRTLAVDGTRAAAQWASPTVPIYAGSEGSRHSHSEHSSGSEYEHSSSHSSTYDYYSQFLHPSVSFLHLSRDPNEPDRLLPPWSPGQTHSGLGTRDEGPMLAAAPMSPGEQWSRQTTPRDPVPGALQNQQSRRASTFASRLASSSNSSAPAARYVSYSSFPSQPLSVDADALGMIGSDRIPSFAQFGGDHIAVEEDNLDWAVEEEMPTARPSGLNGGEMQKKQEESSPVKKEEPEDLKVATRKRRSSVGAVTRDASGRRQAARRFSEAP